MYVSEVPLIFSLCFILHSHIFMNHVTSMPWDGQGVVVDDLPRKMKLIPRVLLWRTRTPVLVKLSRRTLLVHLVLKQRLVPWLKPGILPMANKKKGPSCMRHMKLEVMWMAVANSIITVASKLLRMVYGLVREVKMETARDSSEVSQKIRLHRGVLPSSEPPGCKIIGCP